MTGVIGEDGNLTDTALFDNLFKFRLYDLQIFLICFFGRKTNSVIHERMQCIHEAALRFLSGLRQRNDHAFQFLICIQFSPVLIMLWIVLRCIDICIQLIVS